MPRRLNNSLIEIELDNLNSEINKDEVSQEGKKEQEKITHWQQQKQTQRITPNINHASKFQPSPQQSSTEISPLLFKILVFGDNFDNPKISKTKFINKLAHDIHLPNSQHNIHINIALKNANLKKCQINWQIFNIAGAADKRNDAKKHTKNAHATIITCDPSLENFEDSINIWNSYIDSNYPSANDEPLPKILIGMTTNDNRQPLMQLQSIAQTISKYCPVYLVNLNNQYSTNELLVNLVETLAIPQLKQLNQEESSLDQSVCRIM